MVPFCDSRQSALASFAHPSAYAGADLHPAVEAVDAAADSWGVCNAINWPTDNVDTILEKFNLCIDEKWRLKKLADNVILGKMTVVGDGKYFKCTCSRHKGCKLAMVWDSSSLGLRNLEMTAVKWLLFGTAADEAEHKASSKRFADKAKSA